MKTIAIVFLAVLLAGAATADYQIKWCSINSGGGLGSSASYRLNGTVGQPAAGFVRSTSLLHWIGFWGGEVPTPTMVSTASDAKLLSNGTFVSVPGKIAMSTEGDFAGFFYLEDADRTNGIRIAVPPGAVSGLVRGKSVVNVIGTMGTATSGERQIAAPIVIIVLTNANELQPLGLNNRALGGADFGSPPLGQVGVLGGVGLNNIGLLVKTWGTIMSVGSDAEGPYLMVSDGSGDSVRVNVSGLAGVPETGCVGVIGISGLGSDQRPRIMPRIRSDIQEQSR